MEDDDGNDEYASSTLGLSPSGSGDQHGSHEAPWQLEWKCPRWSVVTESVDKTPDKAAQQPHALCHTSAALSIQEDLMDTEGLKSLGIEKQSHDSFILTVTLLVDKNTANTTKGTTSRKRRRQSTTPQRSITYADSMRMELVRHRPKDNSSESSSSTPEQVYSRLFRWPESALFEEEDDDEEDTKSNDDDLEAENLPEGDENDDDDDETSDTAKQTSKQTGLFGFAVWGNKKEQSTPEAPWKPKTSGLISACLCRLPKPDPYADVADAMDVVNLLSLGGLMSSLPNAAAEEEESTEIPSVEDPGNESTTGARVLFDETANTTHPDQDDRAHSRLVLCCLHSRGKVYVYSPKELFEDSSSSSSHSSKPKDELEDVDGEMASLFLGGAMVQTLQTSYLPLTRPSHVIRLTVPLRRSRKLVNPHTQTFDTASTQQLLDSAVWDNTVDGPSLQFRTKDNIPCLLTHACDLLCVAGPGRRVQKRMDGTTGKSMEFLPEDAAANDHGSGTFFSSASGRTGTGTYVSAASAAIAALRLPPSGPRAGGFVSFLSLRKFAPLRTVYLPFVPYRISPMTWGCITFLLVIGEGGTDKNQTVAVAIRMDDDTNSRYHVYPRTATRSTIVQVGQAPPQSLADAINNALEREMMADSGPPNPGTSGDEKKFVSIRRFQILPIALTGIDDVPNLVVGSTPTSVPPTLACLFVDNHAAQLEVTQRSLVCINQVASVDYATGAAAHPLFQTYVTERNRDGSDDHGRYLTRIETHWDRRHRGRILLTDEITSNDTLWCHQGQGWCLVGGSRMAYFISWEGSTTIRGSHVMETCEVDEDSGQDLVSLIAPTEDDDVNDGHNTKLPFPRSEAEARERLSGLFPASRHDSTDSSARDEEDPFLMDAIESISCSSFRQTSSPSIHLPGISRSVNSFSHEEKSQRLLRRCSSWTALESLDTVEHGNVQTPVVSVRIGSKTFTLSLRASVVQEHYQRTSSSPFHEVLAWLANKSDYFTAASVALDLLKEGKTLLHLWRSFEKIDNDGEIPKPEGLLDGVRPVEDSDDRDVDSILVTLADMTVACLVKGAFAMSSTLRSFLAEDQHYDASRASIMLAATAARMLSVDPEVVSAAMGEAYEPSDTSTPLESDVVWPVRCLLQVGVSRDNLKDTLMLLNATIPDELRHRRRGNVPTWSVPSMKLCTDLVSLILSSSPDAATLLLNLVDEQSRETYWESLEHETQLALATIKVDGKTPLLQEEEVREWVLKQLRDSVRGPASDGKNSERIPHSWLRELVWACLESGGCNVGILKGKMVVPLDNDDDYGVLKFNRFIQGVREELSVSTGMFGIDYDIVVSSLLLLESRGEMWCEDEASKVKTQELLNAACFMAGRRSKVEPRFPLDGSTLMGLCHLSGNIPAGANLVGGETGLVLECTYVLVRGIGLDVDAAERALSADAVVNQTQRKDEEKKFKITDLHRQLLVLLEQHVLGIRKYGDFRSTRRGHIDPVFAARICLRAWLHLNQGTRGASEWIVDWLMKRLEISDESESPHRLACAAFVRALVWPSAEETPDICLAGQLGFPDLFVIQLSHACCGLVEAVP